MRIFISWSGEESRALAAALRDWIKKVLQTVEPWMSEKDIASGARWNDAIASNLRESKVGVICLTPDNISAPWLHFEAGALSKTVDDAYVCPLLFRVEPSDLVGPMSQFQAQRYGREGVLRILETIRRHPEHKNTLNDADFVDSFETWWPRLDTNIQVILGSKPLPPPSRTPTEMMSEVLELVRVVAREIKRAGPYIPSYPIDDLEGMPPSSRKFPGVGSKAKSKTHIEVARMVARWDSNVLKLLGEPALQSIVKSIINNEVGNATSTVMSKTGYKLPEARSFVDALTLAITRLSDS